MGVVTEIGEPEAAAVKLTFWLVADPKKTTKDGISRLNIISTSVFFLLHDAWKWEFAVHEKLLMVQCTRNLFQKTI